MKTKKKIKLLLLTLLIVTLSSCNSKKEDSNNIQTETPIEAKDPLPSWEEGKTKESIKSYVVDVTTEGSPNFIPITDRIATFDNDGNLWSEQPAYFQLFFAISRIKALAPEHPEWKNKQPYKAVLENDMKSLMASGEKGLIEIVMTTHAGMTVEAFEKIVKDWLAKAKHPRFGKPYNELIYQPMLELLNYLRANDFKTYIVSGGGIEFMRPWVEEAYGIPKDQVVGSSIKTEFSLENGQAQIKRLPAIDFIDDKAGKPIGINKFIGKKPVFTSGNSDGDLQMMQYGDSNKHKSFQLYLHHTDAEREWAYDRDSHIGQLNKGLDYAIENGWTITDMKKDWKVIYPFQLNEAKN
ncbi:haloacid dehalogenase-like hydrolase [Tamlana agarivorans]|uniref:Haloacid dehalogenase-like hydrolase n=1 Tax=Pseudotamlana agarivorans TaxID=481183 RepID=A0ACC5UBZ4_9FLAO|nr:HAD family hydrolase [Tamlana agarivorans]MBU2951868.1 haloacid dehalogenase-like hydrolase [Tamlana agarivorans]